MSLTCVCALNCVIACLCAIWMSTRVLYPLCAQLCGEGVMAGAEVTVSSGEPVMPVKEEESANHKAQVILHLQPILHGESDDIADTGTTVLAIETHHDESKAEGEEIEYGYPITCGDSRAVLLFKKFVCPGINVRCVKFNDQLISPKQFVHLAGKATLKDWKRAIRLGGVMLRKMMDSGQIDFYQHDTVCSNTCRSTKFDVLINSTRLPSGTSVQPSLSSLAIDPAGGQVPPLADAHNAAEVGEPLDGDKLSAEWGADPPRLANPATANGHSAKRKRPDAPDGVLKLWRGVADSGMMGEVLSTLHTELITTFRGVELRCEKANLQETDAIILNSLCDMFGLLDPVKQALDLRRSQNEGNKVNNGADVLDEIVENQKKQSCNKSAPCRNSSSKHLRPHGQSNSRGSPSPIQTSSLIQPLSAAGLSAASYAQLAINPHLFTHFSNIAGRRHRAGADRTDRYCHGVAPEREREINEAGNRDEACRLGREGSEEEDTSGIREESAQRTGEFRDGSLVRSEELEETERLRDIEQMIIGRKASKKHKRTGESVIKKWH
ncbi:glucocorticoid modulatory element-binding protein 1-like isoform X2 [Mugil cephalus]|uniref:glucocorticoid modulatory element-binding protein 1-like isoform X2 n=1 Tax=Mugil cephalus TaxID=48193 RepID=UPI001FB5ACD2|nr:glucocorticoid modulatory element-binding protein 1-like isoform X2 [Mugil cephalus]